MMIHKALLTSAVLFFVLMVGCSQPAKKSAPNTATQTKINRKGAACCVNKVPSRFAIIRNDSLTVKKDHDQ